MASLDITGNRFGHLTAIRGERRVAPNGARRTYWMCRCECGNEYTAPLTGLRNGQTRSCGCKIDHRSIAMKHGHSYSRTYSIWSGIRHRCNSKNNEAFRYYGGRGISICARWDRYENFLADMGEPPSLKHTVERRDVNGNYEPSNCFWATRKEQSRNRRVNRFITYEGSQMCLKEATERAGLKYQTVYMRLKNGWREEDALSRPAQPRSKNSRT